MNIKTINEDFEKLLLYNAAVDTSMTYYRMGLLSEVDSLKLAVITLAQQVEKLEDEIGQYLKIKKA